MITTTVILAQPDPVHVLAMYVLNMHNVSWYEIDDMNDLEYTEQNILNKIQ